MVPYVESWGTGDSPYIELLIPPLPRLGFGWPSAFLHSPSYTVAEYQNLLDDIMDTGEHKAGETPASNNSGTPSLEKEHTAPGDSQVEVVRTISRVPGNPNYHEKDGLRTYGDDEDHDHEPSVRIDSISLSERALTRVKQMNFRRLMSLIAMAFLWTGSQIPLYLFGAPGSPLNSSCVANVCEYRRHTTSYIWRYRYVKIPVLFK